MKVYSVVTDCTIDEPYETEITVAGVYSSMEKAQKKFGELKQDFYENDHLAESDSLVVEEDEISFAAYEDGCFVEDHYCIYISALELDAD